jgi:hypothetical protein
MCKAIELSKSIKSEGLIEGVDITVKILEEIGGYHVRTLYKGIPYTEIPQSIMDKWTLFMTGKISLFEIPFWTAVFRQYGFISEEQTHFEQLIEVALDDDESDQETPEEEDKEYISIQSQFSQSKKQ